MWFLCVPMAYAQVQSPALPQDEAERQVRQLVTCSSDNCGPSSAEYDRLLTCFREHSAPAERFRTCLQEGLREIQENMSSDLSSFWREIPVGQRPVLYRTCPSPRQIQDYQSLQTHMQCLITVARALNRSGQRPTIKVENLTNAANALCQDYSGYSYRSPACENFNGPAIGTAEQCPRPVINFGLSSIPFSPTEVQEATVRPSTRSARGAARIRAATSFKV